MPQDYDPYDLYAAYTAAHVYDYLNSYSNTGMGLMGHVLGLVDSSSYEELLRKEILEPLGLNETSLFLTEDLLPNLAPD